MTKEKLCIILLLFPLGCGVVVGTLVDSGISVATYPFKEYIFAEAYKYDNTWEEKYQPLDLEKDPGEVLLGLAVSGGGSRSAYFFSCVMDELSRIPVSQGSPRSYADEVDYISSVSGGSLASAYFCYKRYPPEGKKADAVFFPEFKKAMSYNFEKDALIRYTLGGSWTFDFLTYYDRGDLMSSIWDKVFFDNATFEDLHEAQRRGAPILLVNGTILNNGLKFVFSTVPDPQLNCSEYFADIRKSMFITHSTTQSYVPFQTMGFSSIDSDIRPYRLTKAVVASAAVPALLGPVTLKDYTRKDRLIHIVDGGVYDNYGIETLMQVFTAYLDRHPEKPAKILIIDGSGFFKEDNSHSDDFSVAFYAERPISISWLRTKGYMEYVFQKAREYKNEKGVQPYKNLQFELISLYGVLPSQEDPTYLVDIKENAIKKILRPDLTTQEFLEKLITIRTAFSLSKEDAKAIEGVAREVVKRITK